MPKEVEFECSDGECVWQWDANAYPVDELRIQLRLPSGDTEIREVPNTGRLVLPDDIELEEIVSTGRGGRTRARRWRGPG